ncbi:PhzF family phenazine biosynthesis protein [Belliella sp. R4-6]|uniref:PhzF family phenazine biosynthesis protein n=1 Tax=Belliella alkalica TaxID=1730871 RepID=A0ABS9V7L6_9BACT|nr:PhzF family phenazine biosynthesis protein [Belliella alkalica]MCH7411938.1 PhzF family phenazine biosynthesis protein [Belliella alkalica]
MKLKIYQVDAFANYVFGGNPAAIIPVERWLPDDLMQKIAAENNLSETAYIIKEKDKYLIRWFTPAVEVDLCGHATLAAAHVIFSHEGFEDDVISFYSPRSGVLEVERGSDGLLTLDFPKDTIHQIEVSKKISAGFSIAPIEMWKGGSDYILVYEKEEHILEMEFDLFELAKVDTRGFIITAPGVKVDFVSRWFGPRVGVDEDPVTGSAHTSLTPLWAGKLKKNQLNAVQLSKRLGKLTCELIGDRVKIGGKAITYLVGEIFV